MPVPKLVRTGTYTFSCVCDSGDAAELMKANAEALEAMKANRASLEQKRAEEKRREEARIAEERVRSADKASKRKSQMTEKKQQGSEQEQEFPEQGQELQRVQGEETQKKNALASIAGRWILAQAKDACIQTVGPEIATIGKDGVLALISARGTDNTETALVLKPGGLIEFTASGQEKRCACLSHRRHYEEIPKLPSEGLPVGDLRACQSAGDNDDSFLHRLRWSDGEVWARTGPKLEEYNGSWSRAKEDQDGKLRDLTDMGDIVNGKLTWHGRYGATHPPLELEHQPGGFLEGSLGGLLYWVIIEDDPLNRGTQRLRWNDGDLWFRDDAHRGAEHVE
eukprot:gnl/MRDRNA2_/MRDRNA2_61196_c0_seq1.p1 gnl/MRDRNA2_/MRDRNA2_61196_c0~~gnl/MRDRNA2_/MRDRNA2_61196_c0_seq1.p1  ORF type:complete len:338 (+),score=82.01 gnl/MRDRNA2_/MRDRNA2_61196_c0_seq1:107-1120(+)